MNKLNESFSKIKSVLGIEKYLVLFIVTSFLAFIVLGLLTLVTTSFSIITFLEMNGLVYAFLSFFLTGVISVLFGLNISLAAHNYSKINVGNSAFSGLGVFSGALSAGCPLCGSLLLPLLGIAGGLSVFPFQGMELKLASIVLLGVVTSELTGSKSNACSTVKSSKNQKYSPLGIDFNYYLFGALFLAGILILFNQIQIMGVSSAVGSFNLIYKTGDLEEENEINLSKVDLSSINSTAMAVALLFPVDKIKTEQDAINLMLPTGTPKYSNALGGISFDDPVNSMEYLAKLYPSLKTELKQSDPDTWQRYLNLAAAPRGISCEFCCGVGPQGITAEGESRCGCKHNPAIQALTMGLMKYTDYSDARVLKEAMKWKTIFFPQNMIGLAMSVAGTDPSELSNLPGMVGGC